MSKSPALDVEGVWKEWDADEEIRELLRSDKPVLPNPVSCDISSCVNMRGLLAPLLSRMALHEDRRLPPVDDLRSELELLFKKNKQGLELEYLELSKKALAGSEKTVWPCEDQDPPTGGFHRHWVAML